MVTGTVGALILLWWSSNADDATWVNDKTQGT